MRAGFSSLALGLAILVGGRTDAASPLTFARSGSWQIIEGATCDLIGDFGQTPGAPRLVFTKISRAEYFDLTFGVKEMPSLKNSSRVTIDFGPVENSHIADWELYRANDGTPVLRILGLRLDDYRHKRNQNPPTIDTSQMSNIDWLKITIDNVEFRFDLGRMDRPMLALDQCIDRLTRSWGYDPARQASLSFGGEPANFPGNWVTSSDYPLAARRWKMSGTVWFRLDIDIEGHIKGCETLASTAGPILREATCDLVKSRARFVPARDANGKPAPTYYLNKVRWTPPAEM